MKPLRGIVWGCALLLAGLSAAPADAAWCNVFQVCWHKRATTSYYVAPAVSYYAAADPGCGCQPACGCQPCQPTCTTSYVQRCYYQPVTCYQTKTYYEPVTTYRTSYYYEPVTSYRYSCYYDPCSCSYQQVATPQTCYQLRSQCCPVQSWAQRCCSVPVTTYQQSFYWEPVTSCCSAPAPAVAALPAQDCCGVQPQAAAAVVTPPVVTEQRPPAGPSVTETPNRIPGGFQSYQGQSNGSGNSLRLLSPRSNVPASQPPAAPPANVKLDRIASTSPNEVQGKVVRGNNFPINGARLLFVNADRREPRRTADTDANGEFNVKLAAGGWLVYVHGADGQPVFQRKIEINQTEQSPLLLVSR